MTTDGQDLIKSIVGDALECDPDARAAFVDKACGDDSALRRRVQALLRFDGDATSFLATPAESGTWPWEGEGDSGNDAAGRAAKSEAPPERVGQYEIRRRIASGGAGTVYEAIQDQPHRTVALKMLHAEIGSSGSDLARRFERESQVLAHLQHPGIAHVYEAGVHGEGARRIPYIAMELVRDAQTIVAYADAHELDIAARIELFITVCRAVQHGHERGIVHRDLKPPNILVDGHGHAKVIDFGVARVLHRDDEMWQQTHTGVGDILGTIPYMSPEQCSGEPELVGVRTDVYALGVVLFELLAGRLPLEFGGLALDEAIRTVRTKAPARLARVAPTLDIDLDAITSKALDKDPGRRYDSVAALGSDLRRYLDQQPIVARPPSVGYQMRLFTRRHRVAVGVAVVTSIMLVAATVASVVFAVRANRAAAAEVEQRAVAEQITAYLEELLTSPDPHQSGQDVTVLALLDRTIERFDTRPAELPLVEASVRDIIGNTYLSLRRVDDAEKQIRRALAIWREHSTLGARAIDALNRLGILLREERRDVNGAELAYREAIEIKRRVGDESATELHYLLGNYASVLLLLERPAEAEAIIREVIELRSAELGPDAIYVIAAVRQLAQLRLDNGAAAEAEAIYRDAVERLRRTVADTHPIVAVALGDTGMAVLAQGRSDEAHALFAEAWEIAREARPVGSGDWVKACERLAACLVQTDRQPEAVSLLSAALAEVDAAGAANNRVDHLRDYFDEVVGK